MTHSKPGVCPQSRRFIIGLVSLALLPPGALCVSATAVHGQERALTDSALSTPGGAATGAPAGPVAPAVLVFRTRPAQPPAEPGGAVPVGTSIVVSLKQTLRSGSVGKGEIVSFEVSGDVRDSGGSTILIPRGTPASGTVTESRGAGAFGRAGRLKVSCDYVLLGDNRRVPLRPAAGNFQANGTSRRAPAVLTAALVGLPVGGYVYILSNLFGTNEDTFQGQVVPLAFGVGSGLLAGSLWRGGNVTLPAGTTFAVEVGEKTTPAAPVAAP